MKIENIIRRLRKDGLKIVKGEFNYQECWMCNGTALIDWVDGKVILTSAKYKDVLNQITQNKSHVYTCHDNKKELTLNLKLIIN